MLHISRSLLANLTLVGIVGILLFILAGCGASFSSTAASPGLGGTANTPVAGPPLTPTETIMPGGYGNIHGCPDNTVVSALPGPANVTIRNTDMNSTVVAHVGDVIEVRLPFGHRWSGPGTIPANLQEQGPEGYAWASDQVCIWRYVAQSAGSAALDFYWQALCLQGQMCPMYIANASFTVDVR